MTILKMFKNVCFPYHVRNTFCFPKISKADYEIIRKQCEAFCDTVVDEILSAKKDCSTLLLTPKKQINNLKVISKYGDWLGPVIQKNNKYYRCVKKESVDKFKTLWESGILEVFSNKGYLPKMSISEYCSDEYPIIIEQEKLDVLNITKLSLEQSKKALLFVSMLQHICKKTGYALIDPHYFNYTFCNNRFIYYDLGSFSTIEEYFKYHDYSMVVLGAYRILFSYFPDSVLSKQDLGEFRSDTKVSYRDDYFEYKFYKKATYKYCRNHCSKPIGGAFKEIFSKYECTPWNVITCFLPERKNDVDKLLGEIM